MPIPGNKVSDTEAAFHKNEAEATETIREAKAHCMATIQEAGAACAAAIWEVEAVCTAAIREAETACADHTHTLQQTHRDSMQGLEREAIKGEGRDCQSFLATSGVALQACPGEACGVLMNPLQLLMGNMSLATLMAIPPGIHHHEGTYPCDFPSNYSGGTHVLRNQIAMPFTWPGSILTTVRRWSCRNLWRAALPEVENRMPLKILLKGGQWEAFVQDSDLVQQARGPTLGQIAPTSTTRDPTTSLASSGRW